mmetsp:Transcript_3215/g.7655  ORF Transcript_3215/g.7655 Transcript_3215/m.7655 type:complete len:302 (+) Transcript_3215:377-1282(+)
MEVSSKGRRPKVPPPGACSVGALPCLFNAGWRYASRLRSAAALRCTPPAWGAPSKADWRPASPRLVEAQRQPVSSRSSRILQCRHRYHSRNTAPRLRLSTLPAMACSPSVRRLCWRMIRCHPRQAAESRPLCFASRSEDSRAQPFQARQTLACRLPSSALHHTRVALATARLATWRWSHWPFLRSIVRLPVKSRQWLNRRWPRHRKSSRSALITATCTAVASRYSWLHRSSTALAMRWPWRSSTACRACRRRRMQPQARKPLRSKGARPTDIRTAKAWTHAARARACWRCSQMACASSAHA